MNSTSTVRNGEENETAKENSDTGTGQKSGQLQPAEISLQAILEIARAAQRINTLDELAGQSVQIGDRKFGLRRSVRSLERICCEPRRIAALMLHAADNPDWAWVNFWAVFCPEMNLKQMARLRRTNISTVKYYLRRTELPSDIYDFIPENH